MRTLLFGERKPLEIYSDMKKDEENNFPILAVVLLAIFVPASLLEGRAAHIFWAIF